MAINNSRLIFDIETIPLEDEELSNIQKEELDKKVERYLINNPDTEKEKAKRLIMGTNPFFGKIIVIGLKAVSGEYSNIRSLIGTEHEILTAFWNILKEFNGLYVSYNGLVFDVPFILKRSMSHKLLPTSQRLLDTRRFQKFPHFDVCAVLSDFNNFYRVTLRLACEHCGIPSPKEGDISAENVYEAFLAGRILEIAEYCERDLNSTDALYNVVKNYTFQPSFNR